MLTELSLRQLLMLVDAVSDQIRTIDYESDMHEWMATIEENARWAALLDLLRKQLPEETGRWD